MSTVVNGDGIVNIQDLVLVAGKLEQTGTNSVDVNGSVLLPPLVLVSLPSRELLSVMPSHQKDQDQDQEVSSPSVMGHYVEDVLA